MKKSYFFLAGTLMLGLNLNAQTEQKAAELMFEYGFEDYDEESGQLLEFTDSANPVDQIDALWYYDQEAGSNGAQDITDWKLLAQPRDTVINLLHGITPYDGTKDGNPQFAQPDRIDSYSVAVDDEYGSHATEFEKLGAKGGKYWLKYQAGGPADNSNLPEYSASLFIRGIEMEPYTSYRLTYYVKATGGTPAMISGINRGYYDSERYTSMEGKAGGEFYLEDTNSGHGDWSKWKRVTIMNYFNNDSVADIHVYNSGYWWVDEWRWTDPDGVERTFIQQPAKFFARLSFVGPAATYELDDISIYKSWIAGAEGAGNVVAVDFGYATNMAELANKSNLKAQVLDPQFFSIQGQYKNDSDDPEEWEEIEDIPVVSAEYHNDGKMYIFLAEDGMGYQYVVDDFANIKLSFTNPGAGHDLGLQYNGSLYPKSLDSVWVKAGKYVPDFSDELVFFNPSVTATPVAKLAPTAMYAEPEDGSFQLTDEQQAIKVFFNKPVYINPEDLLDKSVRAEVKIPGKEKPEIWTAGEYNAEDGSVIFSRQEADKTTPIRGDIEFTVTNAKAGASYSTAPDVTFTYSYGPANVAPVFTVKDKIAAGSDEGFKVESTCWKGISDFKGMVSKALMFGLYGKLNIANGAPIMSYDFDVAEAGEYRVAFAASGCLKNSWNDACKMEFRLINTVTMDTLLVEVQESSNIKPEEGGEVTEYDEFEFAVDFAAGSYQAEWKLPNENSYGGGHKGGRILYYFEVSNFYSSAYAYIGKVNDAMDAAVAMKETAAVEGQFLGEAYEALVAVIEKYDGYASNPQNQSPSEFTAVAAEISAATAAEKARIDAVELFNEKLAYAAGLVLEFEETDSAEIDEYVALAFGTAFAAALEDEDIAEFDDEELAEITESLDEAAKELEDRLAENGEFAKNIADLKSKLDELAQYDYFDEYMAAAKTYNTLEGTDLIETSMENLQSINDDIKTAAFALKAKVDGVNSMTAQVKALYALAQELGVDFEDVAPGQDLAAVVDGLDYDDQNLAAALKLAIKAKIYANFAEGTPLSDSIDLSAFMQNSILYSTAKVGVEGEMETYKDSYDPGGAGTQWEWRLKSGKDITTALPGWTINHSGGEIHIGDENRIWDDAIFDAFVACDWNNMYNLKQTVEGMPVGVYTIGGDLSSQSDAFVRAAYTDENGDEVCDTASLKNGQERLTGAMTGAIYGFELMSETLELEFNHASGTGWSRFDNPQMFLLGAIETVEYAQLAAEAEKAAKELFSDIATGVADVEAAASVEYYNMIGIKLEAAPESGLFIKVTKNAAGAIIESNTVRE